MGRVNNPQCPRGRWCFMLLKMVVVWLSIFAEVNADDQMADPPLGLLCISDCATCPVICSTPPPSGQSYPPPSHHYSPPPQSYYYSPPLRSPPRSPPSQSPPPPPPLPSPHLSPPAPLWYPSPVIYYNPPPGGNKAPPTTWTPGQGQHGYPYPYYYFYASKATSLSLRTSLLYFLLLFLHVVYFEICCR
ncbi:hypothetical protein K2173_015799 [Erythroxylum novogranatense]|uniref:Uncharacterized protein n=1 Tax=Erythroxylum novogranatense TaxID=1862640 RepID=A0AAV8SF01_9ROSI|nr:hypothetical protein K2173_015799 [Erythroxylum novogranatense]